MQIRGGIHDRPWGKTLGTFARRAVTGLLAIHDGSVHIVFERGHVIGSRVTGVPASADPAARRQATIDIVARTFGLADGEFVFEEGITHTAIPHPPIHVGGLIYRAARTQLGDRLIGAVLELGARFRLRMDSVDDLAYFGFGQDELAIVQALERGMSIADVDAMVDRTIVLATIYTLASLGAVDCETVPRIARGTQTPIPRSPRASQPPPIKHTAPAVPTITPIQAAALAYRRGHAALRDERLEDAIGELERANELSPDDLNYRCTLAWARFCSAPNKAAAADATRVVLKSAVLRSDHPVVPYYYLGMVERILGRTTQALEHFQEVLELDPQHHEAGTEVRFLARTRTR